MKRNSVGLVAYPSSDEEDEIPLKKRKLPRLSSSLITAVPVDNPNLHQGRIRTQPHVEGQFAAHVYISLAVERRSSLYKLIEDTLEDAGSIAPTINAFWSQEKHIDKHELHISLSRPIYLRSHQREDLKNAVKRLSKQFPPFTISFAAFSEFTNDENTRTFLAMEVGAGHRELQAMSEALSPSLQVIRQREFYSNPRFHASIAWALLDQPPSMSGPEFVDARPTLTEVSPEPVTEAEFLTIPRFPKELVPTLNSRRSALLSSIKTGTFDVNEITVKIGKEVSIWQLSGL